MKKKKHKRMNNVYTGLGSLTFKNNQKIYTGKNNLG